MNQFKEMPQLTYTEALKNATDKIVQIQGRSRRSEYWWTKVTVFLIGLILARLLSPFGLLVLNLLTIPLTFRRLHDTGRSGWWLGVSILLRCVLIIILFVDIFRIVSTGVYDMDVDIYRMIFPMIGKYFVLGGISILYDILLIVFLCLDGDKETNQYGKSPKYYRE